MRLFWLLLFTLALVAFVSVDAAKKEKSTEVEEEKSDEDVEEGTDDDDEEDDAKKKGSKKPATKKPKTSKKEEKTKESNEDDDDDDEYDEDAPSSEEHDSGVKACDKYGPCVCYKRKLDCDDAEADDSSEETGEGFFADEPSKLDSAKLDLPANFRPYYVSFRRNSIKQLRKGKVLPEARANISRMRFSENEISFVEAGVFKSFKNLTHLDLSENKIKHLHKGMFEGLEKLEYLDLSKNAFTTIPRKAFAYLKGLKTLILDGNQLNGVDKDNFEGLESLKKLSLDNCGFNDTALNNETSINVFDHIEDTLTELSLIGNPFTKVPKSVESLDKLEAIDLSGTNLPEVNEDSFLNDRVLNTIIMRNMKYLYSIDECAFCGLKKLQYVDFSDSPNLYLIDENAFGYIESEDGHPENLTEVNFENCNFTSFPKDLLDWKKMSQSTGLKVAGNPFVCDCNLLHLLSDDVFVDEKDNLTLIPKCAAPPRLAGKPLGAVNLQEEHCVVESRVQRFAYWLALLIMLVALSFAVYLVLTSRQLSALIHRHPIQDIRYSHVGREDVQNLETDFQPRSADP